MSPSTFVWNASAVQTGLDIIGQSRNALLAHLKSLLDTFHGAERSMEYYDLVAGIWLEGLTHNIYSAWREVLAGSVPVTPSQIPVIDTTKRAQILTADNAWHEHLRWAVSELLQGRTANNWLVAHAAEHINNDARHGIARQIVRSMSTEKPKILLTQPRFNCSRLKSVRTLWSWRKWVAMDDMRYPIIAAADADWAWRKKQVAGRTPCSGEFADIVMALMPLYIPITLLEGFNNYRNAVLALALPRPKAVFSASGLHAHLTFQVLMAEWRQEGSQLLYHQHGGGYGLEPQLAVEEYETRVSDRYYSWGWMRKGSNVFPLSPAMPEATRDHPNNRVLLNCLDLPRVPYRLMFTPMPGTIEGMHWNTSEFLRGLSDRNSLTIRPYSVDYGWHAIESMQAAAPEARFDSRSNNFALYRSSSLVVHNYLGTSWLETLGLNIPTVCFYDPAVYIYRKESQDEIDALHKVGILHHSGKDAARFVSTLGRDVVGWWNRADVQHARMSFVEKYANFSPDWVAQWEREFSRAIDGAD